MNFIPVGRRLPGDMELEFGIRSVFKYHYSDPSKRLQKMGNIQQDGRRFFVRLGWAPQRNPGEVAKVRQSLATSGR